MSAISYEPKDVVKHTDGEGDVTRYVTCPHPSCKTEIYIRPRY